MPNSSPLAVVRGDEDEGRPQSRVERLIALFDAAIELGEGGEVVVYEHRAPGAEYVLRLWASARNLDLRISKHAATDRSPDFAVIRCDAPNIAVYVGLS